MKLPGIVWRAYHRSMNRWYDLRAWLAGYCAHSPWSPIPGEGSGYTHWKCQRKRAPRGMAHEHRFNNYTWSEDGRVTYAPLARNVRGPRIPWYWYSTPTIRQQRAQDRWHAQRRAEMDAERGRS